MEDGPSGRDVEFTEELDAEDFLEIVWGTREGWVDLPAKVGRYWVPFHVQWPADAIISRRIDTSLRDREDLYYSVAQFAQRGRKIEDVLPAHWLWADLDEVHPTTGGSLGGGFLPSLAVESSPGRYQALWRLDRDLRPKVLEKLNRGLTYALGADRGGWDLTQVLRLPGTRNYKYPDAPVVRLLWASDVVYSPAAIWQAVKDSVPQGELKGVVSVVMPRRPIPRRAQQLLATSVEGVVSGERSARLWELNCLLAEAGLTFDEIEPIVWKSAWNKWSGTNGGRARLARDIRKAMAHVRSKVGKGERDANAVPGGVDRGRDSGGSEQDVSHDAGLGAGGDKEADSLPWISYSSFMSMVMEEPKWLIEGLWTAGSHGILGGEPKTSKTTIALALGLAVASGRPFLGKYPVGAQGPVLFIQEENAPWMMQDRLRKLSGYYGLPVDSPSDVPLRLINNWGFDLAVEEHRDMLEAEVEVVRPVLIVLDPLYLLLGGADENVSAQLRPFLKWIIRLRYEYDTAVMLVHHMGKQKTGGGSGGYTRAGQRLLGSTTLHGFSDSALYTSRLDDERQGWTRVSIEPEFRSMEPRPSMELGWHFDEPGASGMQLEVGQWSLEDAIRGIVQELGDGTTVTTVAERLGVDKRTVLARVRGGELGMSISGGKQGRGYSWKVFLNGGGGDGSDE